jgi:hypothetical protein
MIVTDMGMYWGRVEISLERYFDALNIWQVEIFRDFFFEEG